VYATIGETLNRWMLATFFDWLPAYFQVADIYTHPELYTRGIRIATWLLILVFGSLLGPLVEELYFRGLLLPRLGRLRGWAPLVGALLFVVYHFWSPWLIPIRLLALLPMLYLVWWKKNLYIGVLAHCTLNLVSDAIMSIPLFLS
jgi:membrane protease YdiL (CAAX protease family)